MACCWLPPRPAADTCPAVVVLSLPPQVPTIFAQFPLACDVTSKVNKGWERKIVAFKVRRRRRVQMAGRPALHGHEGVGGMSGAAVAVPPPSVTPPARPPVHAPQMHFRPTVDRRSLVSADDAEAYYGACEAPPKPCARPRGLNLDVSYVNITPYARFKANYQYKGERCGEGIGARSEGGRHERGLG